MAEIEVVLGERGFIRTHQSFMVRKAYLCSMTRERVNCGTYAVPISRRYYQEIRDILDRSKKKEERKCQIQEIQ